jgi:hypothetical protein
LCARERIVLKSEQARTIVWCLVQQDMIIGEAARRSEDMNRPLFDPEHLRIAVAVRAKAWRRRWLNVAATMLVLLIMMAGAVLTIIVMAQILLHVRELVQWP